MEVLTILRLTRIELRLRLRRPGTYLTLLGLTILCWAMVGAPASGYVMLSVNEARVMYTSSSLALGAYSNLSALVVLIGFYLVRGRVAEDLRTGMSGTIAAAGVSNGTLLLSRWFANTVYFSMLVLAFTATLLLRHGVVGEGPIQLGVYVQAALVILAPAIVFTSAMATLFESIPFLLGKAGDVLYFVAALFFIALGIQVIGDRTTPVGALLAIDLTGSVTALDGIFRHFHGTNFSLGLADFDGSLPPIVLPDHLWGTSIYALRLVALGLAMSPLLLAWAGFHRYSPDRVKPGAGSTRRTPLGYLNAKLQFLGRQAQPLFTLASHIPGVAGQVLADAALTLVTSPVAIALILVVNLVALGAPVSALGGLATFAFAAWGITVCDVATRDFAANVEDMTGSLCGGTLQRHVRHTAAAALVGALFMGVIALRWGLHDPLHALACVIGVLSMAALSGMLGSVLRTSRVFLVVFLLGLYIAKNEPKLSWLDAAGFNGSASGDSIALYAGIAVMSMWAGLAVTRRRMSS